MGCRRPRYSSILSELKRSADCARLFLGPGMLPHVYAIGDEHYRLLQPVAADIVNLARRKRLEHRGAGQLLPHEPAIAQPFLPPGNAQGHGAQGSRGCDQIGYIPACRPSSQAVVGVKPQAAERHNVRRGRLACQPPAQSRRVVERARARLPEGQRPRWAIARRLRRVPAIPRANDRDIMALPAQGLGQPLHRKIGPAALYVERARAHHNAQRPGFRSHHAIRIVRSSLGTVGVACSSRAAS